MNKLKIAIGCDHTVTELKNEVIKYFENKGYTMLDMGTYDHTRTHYPIYGRQVGLAVAKNEADLGIAICGTGVGISLSVNKVKGTRCALVRDVFTAIKAKEEYNANVIACGGRVLGIGSLINIFEEFINAKYKGTNKDIIKLIDNKIEHLNDNPDLFGKIINKWEEGYYTNNEKQDSVPLPKIKV